MHLATSYEFSKAHLVRLNNVKSSLRNYNYINAWLLTSVEQPLDYTGRFTK